MHLFGEQGFRGTSVAQIERAAGLTPGAGGLYHHFRSKDDVLTAGLDRHLARLGALRDIRHLFVGVGDLRTELTITARYVLSELEAESELLQIMVTEARSRPEMIRNAVSTVVEGTYAEFATWLEESWQVPTPRAASLTAIALGALISHRLLSGLLPAYSDDDTFVAEWVATFHLALTHHG